MVNLVIVKHEKCEKKYLFRVPNKEVAYAGDLVMVENKNGKCLATCLCDSYSISEGSDEYKSILSAFGASEPLAPVIGRLLYSPFAKELAEF